MQNISNCKFIIIQNGRRQGQEIEPFKHRTKKINFFQITILFLIKVLQDL